MADGLSVDLSVMITAAMNHRDAFDAAEIRDFHVGGKICDNEGVIKTDERRVDIRGGGDESRSSVQGF